MIIFADDVGTNDVPGYWNNTTSSSQSIVPMPNIRNLMSTGTSFSDAHSTPLCAPSRYVLLSGNYQHRGVKYGGTWNVNYDFGNQFRMKQKSIAEVLGQNGYVTSMVGKWHLGGKIPTVDGVEIGSKSKPNKEYLMTDSRNDWSKPMEEGPWDIGFQTSYVTLAGIQNPPYIFLRNGTVVVDDDIQSDNTVDTVDTVAVDFDSQIKYWPEGNYSMPHGLSKIDKPGEGSTSWDSTAYNMILVNETRQFLDDHLASIASDPDNAKPFFSYVSLGGVHIPHSPPDKYLDGTPVAGTYGSPHLDVLYEVDLVVGSLMEMLEEMNILNDTIVVFTSDNGGLGADDDAMESAEVGHYTGGPLRAHKATIYEGGHRVPMTIKWDGGNVPRGEMRSHYVGLSDLYSTLCDLVGVEVPKRQAVDSVSFAKYLMDESSNRRLRDSLGFWSFAKYGNSFRLGQESVRMGDWKLIHNYQNETFELYNLSNDISETTNLVSDVDETLVENLYDEIKRIGPCHDSEEPFYVLRQKRKRTCEWFGQRNTWKRCDRFVEGWIHCRLTCALSSSPQCKKMFEVE
eukprot:CAMPEP_0203718224 /NCGR_PEP_ID=MMETSP0092-20131115/2550_1 /ASSEMBLY_ACC=CAM_ASM_001090 /TAXON_ID=426623 /ORGANISM="Chaetoceros affinis, Strain CCMP159" /LENGTH=567 /DNA_ID=CAMNT_0050597297 /DNA_START=475 /DNA_END=2178 /DNA_ORIENTATION=+